MDFSKLDIFGSQIGFNFQKDNVFKTAFGGFMSLGFIAFVSIFFWNQILDFFNKNNVTFTTSKDWTTHPQTVNVSSHQFMFAVKLDMPNFLQNPLFNITWEKRNYITYDNGTLIKNIQSMQFEPCRPDHWNGLPAYGIDWDQAFQQGGLSTYLCPRIQDIISFGGTYSSPPYDFIKVQVSPCTNNTDPNRFWQPNCQTQSQVYKFFNKTQSVTIMFRMVNYVVNPNDPKNPIKSYIDDTLFFPVQAGTAYQTANIYLTENTLKTDQSIMPFQNIETNQLLVYNGGNFRLQYVIGNTNQIVADFYFLKDPISYTHNRQFTKVSQIASYIGGFCQTFILVAAIVVHQYNSYVCAIKIANQLYDFDLGGQYYYKPRDKQISFQRDNFKAIDLEKSHLPQNTVRFPNQTIQKENDQELNDIQVLRQESTQPQRLISHKKQLSILSKPKTREEGGLLSLDQIQKIVEGNSVNINKNLILNQNISQNTQESQQLIITQNKQAGTLLTQLEQKQESQKNLDQISIPQDIMQQEDKQQIISEKINQSKKQQIDYKKKIEQISVIDDSVQPETPIQNQQIQFSSSHNNQQAESTLQVKLDVNFDDYAKRLNNSMIQLDFTKTTTTLPLKQKESQYSKQIAQSSTNIVQNDKKQLTQSKFNNSVKQMSQSKTTTTIVDFKNQQEFLDEKQFLKQEFEFLATRDKSIKLSVKYFIYKLSCGKFFKTKETQLIDKAQYQMSQDLDIFMILNGIKEVQKLKGLLLTQEEQILFNFFPKPVISINEKEELPSRIQLEQKKRQISQSIQVESKKENEQLQNHSKKLKLNLKIASIVKKATTKFKQPLLNKKQKNQKYDVDAYQKLYQAYKAISKNKKREMDDKLIQQLGDEINKIFQISNQIEKNKERYLSKIQNSKKQLINTENQNLLSPAKKQGVDGQNCLNIQQLNSQSENKSNVNSFNGYLESNRPFRQKLFEKANQKQQNIKNPQAEENNDHALIVFDDPSQDQQTINNSHNRHFSQN
ncbi:transmembrane protein, putative (macronuclear) [Tetrahymena thermophila SB210]|uniref:Transmembrane protein, putative n=1 Tax=Tetrahymena thermophila (strain SB210) TaxID=312017 RepID=Q245T8_TETTS|nr:transmembrane protein, putative [Tetrahymena thermophila SB210]EAS03545.2 transmembrane protein, putative [Tetrahymena thermophila SB210]|eukprot:XP_001023790.2 transmembrane protein, putative [Tetrahymena thermophila SB210]